MKEEAYRTYYELLALREKYKAMRSYNRHRKDFETADDYGERVGTVQECMDIVVRNFKLTFDS